MISVRSPVEAIRGVGPSFAKKLQKLGITTVSELLVYFPRDYDDYSSIVYIADMKPGFVTLRVKFEKVTERRVRRGLHITQADAVDESGKVRVVWFNQPYRSGNLTSKDYLLRGKYEFKNNHLQIVNPSVELADTVRVQTTIVPSYSERAGIKSYQLRKVFNSLFDEGIEMEETLPSSIITTHGLLSLFDAYRTVHQPITSNQLAVAKRRFAFEELFVVMMAAQMIKQTNKKAKALPVQFNESIAKHFVSELPFKLTDDQRKTAWQILQDMQSSVPMNRLLEGDVGTGKTVVAAMASLMVIHNRLQVAFIAPTEILARQHYETLRQAFAHTIYRDSIDLLVGSLKIVSKKQLKDRVAQNQTKLLIGTHAMLEEDVTWHSLGLVVIDEQHRFGVKQRQKLQIQTGHMPHILSMTATPIPRSLALTVYGELDISIIKQRPTKKAEIDTQIVSPNSIEQMYAQVIQSLNNKRQAYIVCPLITESEMLNTASAEETYTSVCQKYLKGYRIGLLHGKLKDDEKDSVMQRFKRHELDVLVTTTVIEVGVDVPNATEIIILGADRFGLAQLHQLRGRVGRGEHPGRCYLVMSESLKPSKRIQAIAKTTDGFELAEYDLELRGAGAIYGTAQHGALDLRYVQLSDYALIAEVRDAVKQAAKNVDFMVEYPYLADKIKKTLQLTYLN